MTYISERNDTGIVNKGEPGAVDDQVLHAVIDGGFTFFVLETLVSSHIREHLQTSWRINARGSRVRVMDRLGPLDVPLLAKTLCKVARPSVVHAVTAFSTELAKWSTFVNS